MTKYPNGRKALDQENDLLTILYNVTDKYKDSLPVGSVGRTIAEEWLGTFAQLPNLNRELIKAADNDYKKMLEEEIDSSKDFIKVCQKVKLRRLMGRILQKRDEHRERELLKG